MEINTTATNSPSVSALRQQMQAFRKGKANISKDDLSSFESVLKAKGADTAKIDNLINNYDKIDLNGDGISASELQTYKKTTGQASSDSDGKDSGLTKDSPQKMIDNITANGMVVPSGMKTMLANFDAVDTTKDGSISHDEMSTYAKANGIEMPHGGPRGAGSHPPRHHLSNNQDNESSSQEDPTSIYAPLESNSTATEFSSALNDTSLSNSSNGTSYFDAVIANSNETAIESSYTPSLLNMLLSRYQSSSVSFNSMLNTSGLLNKLTA